MVGFGALMIANHQGLQSLGRVLTISMGCCMLNALLLPNLLTIGRFATDHYEAGDDEEEGDDFGDEDAEVAEEAPVFVRRVGCRHRDRLKRSS